MNQQCNKIKGEHKDVKLVVGKDPHVAVLHLQ